MSEHENTEPKPELTWGGLTAAVLKYLDDQRAEHFHRRLPLVTGVMAEVEYIGSRVTLSLIGDKDGVLLRDYTRSGGCYSQIDIHITANSAIELYNETNGESDFSSNIEDVTTETPDAVLKIIQQVYGSGEDTKAWGD